MVVAGPNGTYHQKLVPVAGNTTLVCHILENIESRGVFMHQNPLYFSTPLLLLQLSIISISSLLIDLCIKPLGQSTIVSQIFGGVLFGPSILGHKEVIGKRLFPPRGIMMLETTASFGLMFFLFTVGVKMDSGMITRPGRNAVAIGLSVMVLTLALTVPLSFLLKNLIPMDASLARSLPYIAASQCLTPFPNVACLLTELKILNTDLGRLAIASSMFCDLVGISLTAVGFAILQTKSEDPLSPLWVVLSSVLLVIVIVYIIRPAIKWTLSRRPVGKSVGEFYTGCILVTVLVGGFASEFIGQHFVFGPLVLGLVVPEGPPLGAALVAKLDYPVSKVLYPTFLTTSGLKTDIFAIHWQSLWIVGLVILFSTVVKIGAVILPTRYTHITIRDGVVIGLMLNARGICELVLYNLWRDAQVLTDQEFALVVISVLVVTAIITPLIKYLYDPSKQKVPMKRRTIQHAKQDGELRILVCIHNQDTVPSIVNLLEASYPTEQSPIAVIGVILVELVGRSTPMLIAHQSQRNLEASTSRSGHIVNALRQYELQNESCVTVQTFSSISHFETIHDDICRVALDQNVAIVIVPFHKQWAIDGSIGSVNRSVQSVNLKVLERAPCTVGILVDRGILSGSMSILHSQSVYHVAVIYIGGADDVESLCYAARMAKHEKVTLTVIRFLFFGCDNARERKVDNNFIDEVRHANIGNARFIYQEEVVRDGVGLASSIRGLEDGFDLMIVGKHDQESPLLVGLDAWSECPELGIIGDMLASPDFGSTASVLVVQQQRVGGKLINRFTKPVVNDQETPRLQGAIRHGAPPTVASNNNSTWAISMNRTDRV